MKVNVQKLPIPTYFVPHKLEIEIENREELYTLLSYFNMSINVVKQHNRDYIPGDVNLEYSLPYKIWKLLDDIHKINFKESSC